MEYTEEEKKAIEELENSIPKEAIREKIEELEKEYIKWDAYEDTVKINLLKELLGE